MRPHLSLLAAAAATLVVLGTTGAAPAGRPRYRPTPPTATTGDAVAAQALSCSHGARRRRPGRAGRAGRVDVQASGGLTAAELAARRRGVIAPLSARELRRWLLDEGLADEGDDGLLRPTARGWELGRALL